MKFSGPGDRAPAGSSRWLVGAALLAALSLASQAGVTPAQGAVDAPPGAWATLARSGVAAQEVSYVQAGGKFYLTGGGREQKAYDPQTNSWRQVAPLPSAVDHVQAVELAGLIYYVGGLVPAYLAQSVDTVYIYHPATDTFSTGAPIPRGRGAGGVAVYQGKIYYAGGISKGASVPWFDVYDPATNTWASLPDLPKARDHFHSVVKDGRMYVVAGRQRFADSPVAATWRYDFATGAWSTNLAPIPSVRSGYADALVGEEIVVIGGETGTTATTAVEAYNIRTDTWRLLTPLPVPRQGIQGVLWNGAIYLASGGTTQGSYEPTDRHDVFYLNPATKADVSVSSGATPAAVTVGQQVTYSLAVRNSGPGTAAAVAIVDRLPYNAALVSASSSRGGCTGTRIVICALGNLSVGGSASATVVVRTFAVGPADHVASVEGPTPDSSTLDNMDMATANVGPDPARTVTVNVGGSSFTPQTATAPQGHSVKWSFQGPGDHTVTDTSKMDLFDSGTKSPGSTFAFTFLAAGTYTYRSLLDSGMTGTVKVPMGASPASGTRSTSFTITWSSVATVPYFSFDVEIKRPGSASFVPWKTGVTARSATFTPDSGSGTYAFRAHLVRTRTGKTSGWSPTKTINVS